MPLQKLHCLLQNFSEISKRFQRICTFITAQKMKFSIKGFFSKWDQINVIWSHLLKKSLIENFVFLCSGCDSCSDLILTLKPNFI